MRSFNKTELYLDNVLCVLNEERTYKQLLKQTPPKVKQRARKVKVKSTTKTRYGKFFFKTTSGGDEYKTWIAPFIGAKKDILKDNVLVWCSCPYFKYSLEVSLWKGNASRAIASNKEKPVKTNPSMRKFLCKHLVASFDYLKRKKKK